MEQVEKTTEDVLREMLTENTGRSLCDSGDVYGRNWEKNQFRDFENEPKFALRFSGWGIKYTKNVYHFLLDCLEYDPEMQERFDEFDGDVDEWVKSLGDVSGLYGENEPFSVNTYNGEDALSQVIQYTYFTYDGDAYVALQIHQGCDVRGGYTDIKIFREIEDGDILCNAYGDIACNHCDANWYTDDNYHWYRDGSTGVGYPKEGRLEEMEFVLKGEESEGFYDGSHDFGEIMAKVKLRDILLRFIKSMKQKLSKMSEDERPDIDGELSSLEEEVSGLEVRTGELVVLYDEDGNGTCPVCRTGKLEAI